MSSSSSPGNDDMVSVSQTFSPISESLQSPMIPSGENQSNTSSSPINSEQVEANDGGNARQHWDTTKSFYQRAATAYSRGERGHVAYLSEQVWFVLAGKSMMLS
ncbi:hypothetical protein MRB53_031845 [Persea americana]|uniref:Uncharacterized protein n=1 Tax=Persea americana TaxID=3435 RepID=A0ACC2KR46_PERAE|nr:hypothetical protein MRB53_031845 [Persea americana]